MPARLVPPRSPITNSLTGRAVLEQCSAFRQQCGGSPRPVRPAKLRRWFFLGAEWAQLGLRQAPTN